MRHCRSWRAAPLLSGLLVVVLHFFTLYSAAARTRELQLYCLPAEAEPHGVISCVLQGQDGYQVATANFDHSDFIALTRTSNAAATITKSALVRGSDIATAVFTMSVSTGTDVLIWVYLQDTSAIGGYSDTGEVRRSGTTVSVPPWPTLPLGPITCSAQAAGLALRCSTVGRVALYSENNTLSTVHSAGVLFSETSVLGSFTFTSGAKELVLRFTESPKTPAPVSMLMLKVHLRSQDANVSGGGVQTVQIPLLYPSEVPLSKTTGLQCTADMGRITCAITESDTQGPSAVNATHFRVRVEQSVETVAGAADALSSLTTNDSDAAARYWVDVTNTVSLSVIRSALHPYAGIVSWVLKSNDAIYEARFRVLSSMNGQEVHTATGQSAATAGNAADVAGSPYAFRTVMLPNAQSVTLRGCRKSVIAAGNTTLCFIDLANGVSGDTAFYLITTSQRQSSVSNVTYVTYDAACMCRSLWFTYHAPIDLISRVDDYIKVSVYTDAEHSASGMVIANNVPLRLDVLPVEADSGHDTSAAPTDAILMSVGLLFYGGILVVGCGFIVRRSRKSARIRRERARKVRATMQEMDRHQCVPTPSAGNLANNASALTRTPEVKSTGIRAGPDASGYDTPNLLGVGARGAGSEGSSSRLSPLEPAAVVSNVAVPQDRLHSESD
ncbi:hypothetical protein NXY56_006141 [Leishmania guyanensis]|uniref:Uncharacterized protein n=1 Tax=Leishmania guyanensis TaxID=5670 RepID=A0A1E1J4P8_LEIGU|nr:hypothetical protein, conserved [Leishmania guyanensis]